MKKAKKQSKGVPVSRRAVEQRINRVLAKRNEKLLRTRWGRLNATGQYIPTRARIELGEYFILDTQVGGVNEKEVDLEDLARKLKVLEDWEQLVEEEE